VNPVRQFVLGALYGSILVCAAGIGAGAVLALAMRFSGCPT
jgi:hypothetical protein